MKRDAKALYSPDQGRPSYPPETLFRALYPGIGTDLLDVQVAQQLNGRRSEGGWDALLW